MPSVITRDPEETEALGESWGRAAPRGLVIALSGELGAGKTRLVRGLARGLEIPARVHSPSFTLVNEYDGGRLRLFHLDLYRLENDEQIRAAGLEEYLVPDGVTVIEWADRWSELQEVPVGAPGGPALLRRARIEVLSDTERQITYEDSGA